MHEVKKWWWKQKVTWTRISSSTIPFDEWISFILVHGIEMTRIPHSSSFSLRLRTLTTPSLIRFVIFNVLKLIWSEKFMRKLNSFSRFSFIFRQLNVVWVKIVRQQATQHTTEWAELFFRWKMFKWQTGGEAKEREKFLIKSCEKHQMSTEKGLILWLELNLKSWHCGTLKVMACYVSIHEKFGWKSSEEMQISCYDTFFMFSMSFHDIFSPPQFRYFFAHSLSSQNSHFFHRDTNRNGKYILMLLPCTYPKSYTTSPISFLFSIFSAVVVVVEIQDIFTFSELCSIFILIPLRIDIEYIFFHNSTSIW